MGTTFIKVICSHACAPSVPVTANAIFTDAAECCAWPHQLQRLEILRRHPLRNIAKLAKNDNFFSTTNISNKHCKKRSRRLRQQDFALFSPLPLLIASQKSPSTLGFVSQPHGRGHPSSPAARKKRSRHDTKRVNIQQSVLSNRATHRMRRFPFARVWLTCSPEGRTSTI